MRIALRTGGGRGVYELAGSQGDYSASDLFDKEIFYEITPQLILPGRAKASNRQGKPRIKLDNQVNTTHLYRLLISLLLLPQAKREFKKTEGTQIAYKSYSVTVIKIDVSSISGDEVTIRPTEILLESFQGLNVKVDFVERMARVLSIWRSANLLDSEIASLLRAHQATCLLGNVNHQDIEKASQSIFKYLDTVYDPLNQIEELIGIREYSYEEPVNSSHVSIENFGIDDEKSPQIARIENVRRWKLVATRSSAATRFRSDVRSIYHDTCVFSGVRLPKLESTASAGVDAAHILPWCDFDINSIDNGLCLSKQFHWAFDAGVMKLTFDSSIKRYILSIPESVVVDANLNDFSLEMYEQSSGLIPLERLPSDEKLWPNPHYLNEFNKAMFS